MRAVISTDNGFVSPHFGRCPSFTVVDIEGSEVVSMREIPNPGHHPGFLPQYFAEMGVECIVAGGMGRRALVLCWQAGIQWVLGVTGRVDEVAQKLALGQLEPGESLCRPGHGKGYGVEKSACDHEESHGSHEE